jgi:hypothetical protein
MDTESTGNCLPLPCIGQRRFYVMRDFTPSSSSLSWEERFEEWKEWIKAEMEKAFPRNPRKEGE